MANRTKAFWTLLEFFNKAFLAFSTFRIVSEHHLGILLTLDTKIFGFIIIWNFNFDLKFFNGFKFVPE